MANGSLVESWNRRMFRDATDKRPTHTGHARTGRSMSYSIGVDFVRLRLVLLRAEHRSEHDDG